MLLGLQSHFRPRITYFDNTLNSAILVSVLMWILYLNKTGCSIKHVLNIPNRLGPWNSLSGNPYYLGRPSPSSRRLLLEVHI